jgi:hypothetical protein
MQYNSFSDSSTLGLALLEPAISAVMPNRREAVNYRQPYYLVPLSKCQLVDGPGLISVSKSYPSFDHGVFESVLLIR